jgi:HlyD family secretion protein
MNIFKLGVILLVLGGLVLTTLSCSTANTATPTAGTSIATVKQGTILTSVIGTGNLALKTKQELSFGQTGLVSEQTTVKVSEVNVDEGQIVEKDQVLVKADTKDWQAKITSAQHTLDSKKSSLLQAQSSLESAEYNLQAQTDIKEAQDKIDNTNIQLQQAQIMISEAAHYSDSEGVASWENQISLLEGRIEKYQKELEEILTDPLHSQAASSGTLSSVADIKTKQRSVEQARAQVVNAQNAVDDAQTSLDDVKNSVQEIKAPFKGLITKVDVNVGDIVSRSADLIEIAQPDQFVADILVTENDVMNLSLDQFSTVSFNALTGLNFPAKITKIAPLASVSQGVVNYSVTVELTSTTPVISRPTAAQNSSQTPNGATVPSGMPSPGEFQGNKPAGVPSSGMPKAQNITLKDGLSATVTIVIQQKDNVLLVPNRAITRLSGTATVQVMKDTLTEVRMVKTGLSDSSNTEITEGLSNGEQVLVKTNTASSNQFGPPGGAFRMP